MAVAFDAATDGGASGTTTKTFSHTCTGASRILIVYAQITGSCSGVTYNAVAMTKIGSEVLDGTYGWYASFWYLVAPATGANDVVITGPGASTVDGICASYTGVDQVTPVDVDAEKMDVFGGGDYAATISVTTTNANTMGVYFCENATSTITGFGTGQTERLRGIGSRQSYMGISDELFVSAASNAASFTGSDGNHKANLLVALNEVQPITFSVSSTLGLTSTFDSAWVLQYFSVSSALGLASTLSSAIRVAVSSVSSALGLTSLLNRFKGTFQNITNQTKNSDTITNKTIGSVSAMNNDTKNSTTITNEDI